MFYEFYKWCTYLEEIYGPKQMKIILGRKCYLLQSTVGRGF